ncbi:hypothetical protein ACHAPT_011816 [Fusarium lateritium]
MVTATPQNSPLDPTRGVQQRLDSGPGPSIPVLYGNDGEMEHVRMLTPCTPDTLVDELRRKFWAEGFLWVKGLLDPDMINNFRREYFTMISEGNGMLKPDSDTCHGIFNPEADWREFLLGGVRVAAGVPNEGPFVEKAYKAHRLKVYVDFKDEIGRQMEPFVGCLAQFDEPWCFPRSLLRFAVPGGDMTPVHYDQIFLRAGPRPA